MVGEIVQSSQSLYSFTFNALIDIHKYIYSQSTTEFTFKKYSYSHLPESVFLIHDYIKDPVLPIKHCTLQSPGGHFCDVENSEAFVFGQNSTL